MLIFRVQIRSKNGGMEERGGIQPNGGESNGEEVDTAMGEALNAGPGMGLFPGGLAVGSIITGNVRVPVNPPVALPSPLWDAVEAPTP